MSKPAAGRPAQSLEIVVNGKPQRLPAGATIADLIAVLALGDQRCAVEVNTKLVRRDQHPTHVLEAGDKVEVVTLVGGG